MLVPGFGETVVLAQEGLRPGFGIDAGVQYPGEGWNAVGFAVEHVQLMGKFMDHHVVGVGRNIVLGIEAAARHLDIGPGQDDRAVFPRFTAGLFDDAMHQPDFVLHRAPDDELARIQHDAVPASIPLDPEPQDGHAGLHRDADHHFVGQRQLMRR